MLKYLRIAVTALSLTACVLLIVLWVRGYWWQDGYMRPSKTQLLRLESGRGQVGVIMTKRASPRQHWHWIQYTKASGGEALGVWRVLFPRPRILGFSFAWNNKERGIVVPFWFLVVLAATFAAAPWLTRRFSLRTLLITTTLVAMALGIVVAAR